MVSTDEVFRRQKIAEEVADKLLKKAKQRVAESDEKSSHLPNETRAIVRVYNGLLLWRSEGYPNEILWFYQYGSIPCWQRMSMFDRDVNTAIVLLKDKGKAALAADIEGRWQNIIQTAKNTDKALSELSEHYNHDEDNPAYANDVKSALFDIKTYASQLGESLFEVAKQQASEDKTQLEKKRLASGGRAGERKKPKKKLKPLSEKAAAVLELLKTLPEHRGMTGPKILEALDGKNILIDQSTLTKNIIPELKPYGVKNRPRIGYYIEQ